MAAPTPTLGDDDDGGGGGRRGTRQATLTPVLDSRSFAVWSICAVPHPPRYTPPPILPCPAQLPRAQLHISFARCDATSLFRPTRTFPPLPSSLPRLTLPFRFFFLFYSLSLICNNKYTLDKFSFCLFLVILVNRPRSFVQIRKSW